MMLVYDLRTMQLLFHLPPDYRSRDRQVVSIAAAIRMIRKEQQRRVPAWKTFYQRHREEEIARRKVYRARNPEKVAEYNRNYHTLRKRRKAIASGQRFLSQEVIACST